MRFRRSARVLKRRDYQRIYNTGVRAAGRWLVVFAVRGEGAGKLGVTASRKVGGSVVRSRCKRRIREMYRLHRRELEFPVELVVNARKGCDNAPWNDLVAEFEACLRRIRSQLERR
ncbi:MAG: ribonuclease P protein component [Acidobacteria bacterium]|nr:ribonuclease P protein component [Acidobacteriota bacterium]